LRSLFSIENIDCPVCASKIEAALKKLPGVAFAAIDFANQRLHLEADDLVSVRAEIRRIQPGVTLTSVNLPHPTRQRQANRF
jgi:Zn2+/Cd2+-exporting ATPase